MWMGVALPLTPRAGRAETPVVQHQQPILVAAMSTVAFAYRPKAAHIKLLPTVSLAVRHERLTAETNAEVTAKALRTYLDAADKLDERGVAHDVAFAIITAAFVASYRIQHGGPVEADYVDALRKLLAHAIERKDNEQYACEPGSAGTGKHTRGAKALLDASFCWNRVFSAEKLQGAKSRTATSDGCALNLTLLAECDSGGHSSKTTTSEAEKKQKKKNAEEAKKKAEEEKRKAVPLVTRADDAPIAVGGDFGRSGG